LKQVFFLLLRIVDPDFKTPVAAEVGLINLFCMAFIYLTSILYPFPCNSLGINCCKQ